MITEMSYRAAMELAGATVHEYESFGSYQGDWWAKVTYNGETGWVNGSYGSCSGCDSLQAEFDFKHHEHPDNDYYDPFWSQEGFKDDCVECQKVKDSFADFGKRYASDLLSQSEAETRISKNLEWDSDAQQMLDFVIGHAVG